MKFALEAMASHENSNPSRIAERAIMAEAAEHPYFETLSVEDLSKSFPWHPRIKS